jgi:transcriptional regulator with XRE-family HTH domain
MQRFGALLVSHIGRAGMTMNGFAKAVGAGSSSISQIATGKRTPPLAQIERWADVLVLKGERRAEFLESASLEHTPELIQMEYAKLKAQVQRLESRLAGINKDK